MDDPTVTRPAEPAGGPPAGAEVPAPAPAPPPAAPPPVVAWQAPPEPTGPAPGIEFAGYGARLVAYIVDIILLTIVCGVLVVSALFVLVGASTIEGNVISTGPGVWFVFALLSLLSLAIGILYFPWFWARGGSTPGMNLFRIRVVRDVDGSRIGWGAAILRFIGFYVSVLVFYIGFIWIFFDKRRRGWPDLIAGTVVIKTH